MISTLMLIALGFVGASLLALLIVPYIWRYAVRTTSRRLQFAAPDSVVEVRADRDQLRAEHALETRKLELHIRKLKDKLAQDAVELTETNAVIESLRAEAAEKDAALTERQNEIAELRASMSPMETELASRTSTVQQLRETIRQLEERVREQDLVLQQVIDRAGLAQEDVEKLRAETQEQEQERSGPPLPMELMQVHEDTLRRLGEFSAFSGDLDQRRKKLMRRRQSLLRLKEKLANSRTISAREAKDYQARIAEMETDQSALTADFERARTMAGALHKQVAQMDETWQEKINPYPEIRERIDAVLAAVEQTAGDLKSEGDPRAMLTAIPGGKLDETRNIYSFEDDGEVFGVRDEPEPAEEKTQEEAAAQDEDAAKGTEEERATGTDGTAGAEETASGKKQSRTARVMSLAERIRALQEEIN